MQNHYVEIAADALQNTLRIRAGEEILIITDEKTLPFGEAYRVAASNLGFSASLLEIPVTKTDGAEPSAIVSAGMLAADVVIAVSKFSLTHCKALKQARLKGTRFLSTPNINETIFLSPAMNMAEAEKADTVRASELFSMGDQVRVTTKEGTDLSFRIGGWSQVGGVDNATIDTPGTMGNLPAGESFVVPLKGSGNGILVADGSLSGGQGVLKTPVCLTIENGLIVRVEGNEQAEALERIFDASGENGRNFAEFAIGLNRQASIIGAMVMDEKLRGTAHIGIGNSECMGGDIYANSHIDVMFLEPTIEIDGELMAKDGELFLGEKRFEDYKNYPADELPGAVKLIADVSAVKDGVLCRKWQDAWGKTYFTKVGVASTALTVLDYYNALLKDEVKAEAFGGKEEVNRLNRMFIRYGMVSV